MNTCDYDIIVCGAGVAGVAAALAAARAGRRVALVEKTLLFGGLATSGLVNIYLPLCDGRGTQVTFGIAEELLHLSLRYGPGAVPAGWRDGGARYQVTFSPASLVLALDEALQDAGVALWLDTLACAPVRAGNRVVGVEVETKAGREALRAPVTIDATGDADIAHRAGAPCATANNIMSLWALEADLAAARRAAADGDATPLLDRFTFGGDGDDPELENAERRWGIASAAEITAFTLEGRRILREHYRDRQAEAGRHNRYPLTLPTQAQYRMTRRIVGRATMAPGQAWHHVPDAVGLIADWRGPGQVWEVPYGSLLSPAVGGLLVAGRCTAAAGDAWHVTRVIPAAALTGQVAGVAAALAKTGDPADVPVARVQGALRAVGIPCAIDEVYQERPA
jgi:2-polyprenyl-6-methoxyphenol hydroxylase-like FAD-dependent oxidoreductase